MAEIFVLFLSIKGHINFYQFERSGQFTEQRYRQQFEKPFDFMELNKELAFSRFKKAHVSSRNPKEQKHWTDFNCKSCLM